MIDQYHISFIWGDRHGERESILNSLKMYLGQWVVLQGKEKEKECVVKDIRYNPHSYIPS